MNKQSNYGEWKVIGNFFDGQRQFIAGRLIDKDEVQHSGNLELHGNYSTDEKEVEKTVAKLNALEREARQFAYFKENSTSVLYAFCNRCQYFTSGTPRQYEMFFDRAKNAPEEITRDQYLRELSAILWICSDGKDSIDTIRGVLFSEYLRVTAPIE